MHLVDVYKIPIWLPLAMVAALLAIVVVALVCGRTANATNGRSEALSIGALARKVGIAIVGGLVLAAGVAMIVLPGPAVVVIPIGLTILASEFEWPRRMLTRFRERAKRALKKHEAPKPHA